MAIINKVILHPTFYIPLSYHRLTSFSVNLSDGVAVANVGCYFDETAFNNGGVPLIKASVQIVGMPEDDVVQWIYNQLVSTEENIPVVPISAQDQYPWAKTYTLMSRTFFQGGSVTDDTPNEEPIEEPPVEDPPPEE